MTMRVRGVVCQELWLKSLSVSFGLRRVTCKRHSSLPSKRCGTPSSREFAGIWEERNYWQEKPCWPGASGSKQRKYCARRARSMTSSATGSPPDLRHRNQRARACLPGQQAVSRSLRRAAPELSRRGQPTLQIVVSPAGVAAEVYRGGGP